MPFSDLEYAVQALTNGEEKIILDDVGMPSFMVVMPKKNSSTLCLGLSDNTHPAFLVGEAERDEVYISKYPNIVKNNRAYSLPLEDVQVNISFDEAVEYCQNKGSWWGLMPASLWGAIALEGYTKNILPHGNTNNGADYSYPLEKGTLVEDTGRTLCGSGFLSWNHNHLSTGISDLVGIGSEWLSGVRLVEGELQFIPNADAMQAEVGLGNLSEYWRAISQANEFISPNSSQAIKLVYQNSLWKLNVGTIATNSLSQGAVFKNMESLITAPSYLKELMLFPAHQGLEGYQQETIIVNNLMSEAILARGGSHLDQNGAGINAIRLNNSRSTKSSQLKFRAAYYGNLS